MVARRLRISLAAACLVLALAGCITFAPHDRAAPADVVPDQFSLYDTASPAPERWWESFGSEELNGIVEEALTGNLTLQQMYARLEQAGMVARQARSGLWPALDASSSASVTRQHTDTGDPSVTIDTLTQKLNAINTLVNNTASGLNMLTGITGGAGNGGDADADDGDANADVAALLTDAVGGLETLASGLRTSRSSLQALQTLFAKPASTEMTFTTEAYKLGLEASYEVDLWGRIRSDHKSAILDYQASIGDVYAGMLSLSGSIVLQWCNVVAYQQQLALVRDQIAFNETTEELIELRFLKGQATALDVLQQRQILAQTEALIPPLESGLRTAKHELAVLLGRPPVVDLGIEGDELPTLGTLPEPGLPADLLANRPDVLAAGLRLRSADWQVSAARADRLPSLRLTASASYGADEWDLLFDNWMASLAGSVTGPIFDAGRRKAEVMRTRAVVDERLAAYREAVLDAVKEVENAMFQETKQAEYIEALERQIDTARASYEQAEVYYRKGVNDYLPVLSALSQLQVLERTRVQAQLNNLGYRIQLHLALGGEWMKDASPALEG